MSPFHDAPSATHPVARLPNPFRAYTPRVVVLRPPSLPKASSCCTLCRLSKKTICAGPNAVQRRRRTPRSSRRRTALSHFWKTARYSGQSPKRSQLGPLHFVRDADAAHPVGAARFLESGAVEGNASPAAVNAPGPLCSGRVQPRGASTSRCERLVRRCQQGGTAWSPSIGRCAHR